MVLVKDIKLIIESFFLNKILFYAEALKLVHLQQKGIL